jgi:carboxymethylenebutenolidase
MHMQIKEVVLPEGTLTVQVFRPDTAGVKTGVILYMDAFGPRPALAHMAERFAALGHVVLLPDLFYRFGGYGPFDAATAFSNDASRAALMRMITGTTQAQTVADTAALLDILVKEEVTGPVAAVGYCMGGARALCAAAYPDKIRAAASLHGGNLASDAPDSPHLKVAQITGKVYVGSAGVDGSFPPAQSARLA